MPTPRIRVLTANASHLDLRIQAGRLPELLEALIEIDCDYGSRPPVGLRRLGQALVDGITTSSDLTESATGALHAELAALLAFSREHWPLEK